jgi:plastocyanin
MNPEIPTINNQSPTYEFNKSEVNTKTAEAIPTQNSNLPPVLKTSHKKFYLALGITIVLLSAVVVGSIIITHNNHLARQVDIEEHKYEATVVISSNNYTPATLVIKPDTEVFFENHSLNQEGENGLPHTAVQSKASTDQTAGFSSGQILAQSGYGYIFRKSGTYHFFDADNPTLTETIVVKN